MVKLREFVLDERAEAYLAECLRDGGPLARRLLAKVSGNGGLSTLATAEATEEALYAFAYGGLLPRLEASRYPVLGGVIEPIANTDDALIAIVCERLRDSRSNVLVVEDGRSTPTDGWIANAETHIAVSETSVYALATYADSERAVHRVLRDVHGHPVGVGVVSKVAGDASQWISQRRLLSDDDVEHIASAASMVLVGAYDGESVVVWRNTAGA